MVRFVLFVAVGIAVGIGLASVFGYPSSTGGMLGAAIGVVGGIWTATHK